MSTRERPPAMQVPARPVILTGTALFFLGFVILLPFWGWLGASGHRVWLWTALAGWLLGLLGLLLFTKHRREGRAR